MEMTRTMCCTHNRSNWITVHCGLISVACWCEMPSGIVVVHYGKQRLLNYEGYLVSCLSLQHMMEVDVAGYGAAPFSYA